MYIEKDRHNKKQNRRKTDRTPDERQELNTYIQNKKQNTQ